MADKTRIVKLVTEILERQLGLDPAKIVSDANIVHDLGADTLDTVEILMDIEETFQIEIRDEDFEKVATVGDVVAYLEAHLPASTVVAETS